jgi:hypothetical protein
MSCHVSNLRERGRHDIVGLSVACKDDAQRIILIGQHVLARGTKKR